MDMKLLRQIVDMDPEDALSRYALGEKLYSEDPTDAGLAEGIGHLRFANQKDPSHLATYYVLGQALIAAGELDEARAVLEEGIRRTAGVPEGQGGDLKPQLEDLLESI